MAGINLIVVHTKNQSSLLHYHHNDPSFITLVNISVPPTSIEKLSSI